jgi:hypothetical protein
MEDRLVGDEAVRPADKPMLSTGLVSITFRPLDPEEILRLAVQARIETIEWGGDVHVPVGDLDRARETGRLTFPWRIDRRMRRSPGRCFASIAERPRFSLVAHLRGKASVGRGGNRLAHLHRSRAAVGPARGVSSGICAE